MGVGGKMVLGQRRWGVENEVGWVRGLAVGGLAYTSTLLQAWGHQEAGKPCQRSPHESQPLHPLSESGQGHWRFLLIPGFHAGLRPSKGRGAVAAKTGLLFYSPCPPPHDPLHTKL